MFEVYINLRDLLKLLSRMQPNHRIIDSQSLIHTRLRNNHDINIHCNFNITELNPTNVTYYKGITPNKNCRRGSSSTSLTYTSIHPTNSQLASSAHNYGHTNNFIETL